MQTRGRRSKRKWKKGRIAAIFAVIAVFVLGGVFIVHANRTKYEKVNKGMGEYIVQANDKLLGKDTGKEIKKALYVPRKIDKTKKLIAFSFDDGPKPGNTERVVKALEKNDARASFYMLGQNAKAYPKIVKMVSESGNEVSGHSYDHPLLSKLSAAGVAEQYKKMNDAIFAACGSKAANFRPPYGGINDTVRKNIDGPLILWSVDTLDWKTRNTKATVDSILKHAKDGDIILMHDIHEPTVKAVEEVLPQLKAKGYEVCTVSELLEAKGIKVKKGQTVISASQIQ